MRTMLLLSSLLGGGLLTFGSTNANANANADDQYPCMPDIEGGTWLAGRSLLIDHSYIVRHTMGPHSFDIPFGYIIRRPPPEWVNCPGDKLTFAYWMPDLRSPKDDMWAQPNFQVQEPGRPKPGSDEFVVKVMWTSLTDKGSPSNRFRNFIGGLDKPYGLDIRYGLLHVLPDENYRAFDNYADLSHDNNQVFLECTKSSATIPNPTCEADLYFSDIQLELTMQFPRDALPR